MDQIEFMQLIEETLEAESGTLSYTDRLDEIDWDSLANISFIAEVDNRLGVTVNSEQLAKSLTIADLFDTIKVAIQAQ
ncbi:acyl carrier protein [Cryobacterium sinapicolor]|uniref:Acyl carrier protein n=1 Tax=Cryobacterium sinapicolor TaxID=1259236 RepID=A0ABY2ITT2_9MICO|nr:phosphopantetheine-binding protein [Cryobacterium sinapicolor]TFC94715.1 acyl carrier protein [Cryobacterium sinapicolor]